MPRGYSWRPLAPLADLERVMTLLHACDLHDVGSHDLNAAWIDGAWKSPNHRGGVVVEDLAGHPVAEAEIEAVDPMAFVDLFPAVHPDHRSSGLVGALVAWGEGRAIELAGGATTLYVSGVAEDARVGEELSGLGYRHVRTFWHMHRPLPASDQPPAQPGDGVVRPFVDGADDRAVYEVMREAFEGHFGSVPMSMEAWWDEQRSSEHHDPGLIHVAVVDDRIVGAVSSVLMDDLGWIGDLGVLRSFRGRGLGRALLRRTFAELAERGADVARLNVDAANEAGATRLYRSVGMTVRRAFRVYEKRVGGG